MHCATSSDFLGPFAIASPPPLRPARIPHRGPVLLVVMGQPRASFGARAWRKHSMHGASKRSPALNRRAVSAPQRASYRIVLTRTHRYARPNRPLLTWCSQPAIRPSTTRSFCNSSRILVDVRGAELVAGWWQEARCRESPRPPACCEAGELVRGCGLTPTRDTEARGKLGGVDQIRGAAQSWSPLGGRNGGGSLSGFFPSAGQLGVVARQSNRSRRPGAAEIGEEPNRCAGRNRPFDRAF